MNLAFTTILVLVALFPGFFLQAGYHVGPFSKKYARSSVFGNAAVAVLPSLVYHAVAISLINKCAWIPNVSFEAIGQLAFGDGERLATVFSQHIGAYVWPIVLYILFSVTIGAAVGNGFARFLRWRGYDIFYPVFRFDNTWYYLISGESLGWPSKGTDVKIRKENLAAVRAGRVDIRVEILTTINDQAYIYEGLANHYFLNKEGLDRIHLNDCSRKIFPVTHDEFVQQQNSDGETKKIYLGNDFVIFRDSIININFNYLSLRTEELPNREAVRKLPEADEAIILDIDGTEDSAASGPAADDA